MYVLTIPITPGDNINGDTSAGGATANCDAATAADDNAEVGGGIAIGTFAFKSFTATTDGAADAAADTDPDTDADAIDDNAAAATARAGVSGLLTASLSRSAEAAATAAATAAAAAADVTAATG